MKQARFFSQKFHRKGRVEADLDYRIVLKKSQFEMAAARLRTCRTLVLDVETSCRSPFTPESRITILGLATPSRQYIFPLSHSEAELDHEWVVGELNDRLGEKRWVAHNAKFDFLWLQSIYGVKWKPGFCTMLAHYMLNENTFHGLKEVSQVEFKAPDWDIDREKKKGNTTLAELASYNAYDLYYTWKLYEWCRERLPDDPATLKLFKHLMMPMSRAYVNIEKRGIYVDPVKLDDAYKFWCEQRDTALAELDRLFPSTNTYKNKKTKEVRTGVNWGSPKQVAEVLFERGGLKPLDLTGGGAPSTSESVLLRLAEFHPAPGLILRWREAAKNVGTFFDSWRAKASDNRLHPTFKLSGTVTGRLSCEEPNLQQVPRDKRVRSVLCSRDPWVLVEFDYSQVELRIVAEMSRDPEMLMAYQTGQDIHRLTCQRIMSIKEPTSEERKKAKAINFGFIYGMWWKKFILYARDSYGVTVSPKEAENIRKGFFRTYKLESWHDTQKKFASRNGYVRSLLGRKRRLPDLLGTNPYSRDLTPAQKEQQRQAINSPVQSCASDLLEGSIVEIDEEMDHSKVRTVATVHDAGLFEVRRSQLLKVCPEIKHRMENPRLMRELGVEFSVPLVADCKVGPWGAGEEIKDMSELRRFM